MGEQKSETADMSIPLSPNNAVEAEYERALGRLTIIFSRLHVFLESYGWKVWRLGPFFGSILTGDLPIKHLVEKLRETMPYTIGKEDDRKQLLAILKRVEKAADRRNTLLHLVWSFSGVNSVNCFPRRKGMKVPKTVPSVEEINTLHDTILYIEKDLLEFEDRNPLKCPTEQDLEKFIEDKGKKG